MNYKIIAMKATAAFLGFNFEVAAEKLAEEVRQQIALGWEPQGGVSISGVVLFQAMIKRR